VVAKTHLLRAVPEEERGVHKEDDRPHLKLRQSRPNSQRKHFPPHLRSARQQYEEQPRGSGAISQRVFASGGKRVAGGAAQHKQLVLAVDKRQPDVGFEF